MRARENNEKDKKSLRQWFGALHLCFWWGIISTNRPVLCT